MQKQSDSAPDQPPSMPLSEAPNNGTQFRAPDSNEPSVPDMPNHGEITRDGSSSAAIPLKDIDPRWRMLLFKKKG